MSEVTDRPAAPAPPAATALPTPARARAIWGPLALLYLVAAALYTVLALRSPLPSLFPDEYRYAHLARGLADGTGFDWHGVHLGQSAALYVYVIAPAWAIFHSTVDAYAAAKILGTLLLCAQAVPVWIVARDVLESPRLALLPAALSIAGTWMLAGTAVATEALAFPLATTSLCLAVLSLRRSSSRLGLLALGVALLAAWARLQVVVLVPALLAAFALDALRRPAGRRAAALRAHRAPLAIAGALLAAGVIVALAAPGAVGDYKPVLETHPSAGGLLRKTGLQLLELIALGGFAPVLLAAGALGSRRALRDDRSGPLLIVFWLAALATAVQSGWYIASDSGVPTGIDRYVAYALPLAMVLVVLLVRERLAGRVAYAVAALLGLTLLAAPGTQLMAIERAFWSTSYRVHQLAGLSHGTALAAAAVVVVLAAFALQARLADRGRAAVAVGLVVLGVFAVQGQAAWKQHVDLTRSFRTVFPADLEWIDHHSRGNVAWLGATVSTPQFAIADFFNRHITRAYVPQGGLPGRIVPGGMCAWQVQARSGALQFQPGCEPDGSAFYVDDPTAQVTLYGARTASDARYGTVAELPKGTAPRVQALLFSPCPRYATPVYSTTDPAIKPPAAAACQPQISGQTWLDAPAQVELRFRGGTAPHAASAGQRTWDVPAGQDTTIALKLPAGASQFALTLDWSTQGPGDPAFLGAALVSGGRTTPITS